MTNPDDPVVGGDRAIDNYDSVNHQYKYTEHKYVPGLTKREYFFLKILSTTMISGAIMNWRNPAEFSKEETGQLLMKEAINLTDQAIAELNKQGDR